VEIAERISPNHGPRRGVMAPDLIVLHYTAMESAEAALDRLCDPAAEVSCHYLIDEAGRVTRLVSEMRRAWHAGEARWGALTDVNSHSLGIELANPGPGEGGPGDCPDFPEPQMDALIELLHGLMLRWGVPPERVVGHSDVAPGRKIDPGPGFDWRRLAREGVAVWPERAKATGEGDPAPRVFAAARRFGYPAAEESGEAALLAALQMRFAPEELGAPPSETLAARLETAAARWPVNDGRTDPAPAPGPAES
jgi:N-acetylmuramoyl-L-alanine amidase